MVIRSAPNVKTLKWITIKIGFVDALWSVALFFNFRQDLHIHSKPSISKCIQGISNLFCREWRLVNIFT